MKVKTPMSIYFVTERVLKAAWGP
jgi:hypothetical protein